LAAGLALPGADIDMVVTGLVEPGKRGVGRQYTGQVREGWLPEVERGAAQCLAKVWLRRANRQMVTTGSRFTVTPRM
jgi:hypothetical protein